MFQWRRVRRVSGTAGRRYVAASQDRATPTWSAFPFSCATLASQSSLLSVRSLGGWGFGTRGMMSTVEGYQCLVTYGGGCEPPPTFEQGDQGNQGKAESNPEIPVFPADSLRRRGWHEDRSVTFPAAAACPDLLSSRIASPPCSSVNKRDRRSV